MLWIFLINQSYVHWKFKVKEWNCSQASIDYFKRVKEITKDNKIVTEKVYNKAITKLKQYCNLEKDTAETPSFINQLVDVAFRKIDAIKWLTYWLTPDPMWEKRRDYLNKISKKNNEKPVNIITNFKKVWWNPEQNIKANNNTLYWKYLLVCDEIWDIYFYLLGFKDTDDYSLAFFEDTCKQIAKDRYSKEITLIQKITFINFYTDVNKKLFESFSKHTEWKKSFSDKLMKLYDKFTVWLWDFQYLVLRFVKVLDAND